MKTSAIVITDSVSPAGKRITTLSLVFPRFILSQYNKHRVFSNNAASSRAVPTAKIVKELQAAPVIPVEWGKNQSGMVAEAELDANAAAEAEYVWLQARDAMLRYAEELNRIGVHKQITNRLLEPFSWARVVVTSTEWDNFFNLRLEHDSQPEMQELARCMKEAMDNSTPIKTEYHLPYVAGGEFQQYGYAACAMLSAARCARVSYLNHDGSEVSFEKDMELAGRLHISRHSVCFEHQAKAYDDANQQSGNFTGWKQHRKVLGI